MIRSIQMSLSLLLGVAAGVACLVGIISIVFVGGELTQVHLGDVTAGDMAQLGYYSSGLRFFDEGRFTEARSAFDSALNANSPLLVAAATNAGKRTRHLLRLPSFVRPPIFLFVQQAPALQWLLVAIATLIALFFLQRSFSHLPLKPGCDISRLLISADGSSINETAVLQLLQDRLQRIGFRFQKPGGLGGAIGPALAVGTLLPSASATSPLKEAISGFGEITGKGGAAFVIAQAERAVQLIRRNRRYHLTGFLRASHEMEVTAWIKLTDRKTEKELALVSASSKEVTLYEQALRAAKIETKDSLVRVINVLAMKIWHSLSEGARPGVRPKSWLTVAHFVGGLDALADVRQIFMQRSRLYAASIWS